MKYKDPTTGNFKELKIRATDELPVGSEIDVDDNTTIPAGWEEVDVGTTLFEGDSTGDITLSDNATNYDYIEVEFRNTYSTKQATNIAKLYPEDNKYFTLMNANFDGNAYIYASNYYFDGASIKHGIVGGTTSTHIGYRIQASSSITVSGGDYISILKVIGYKK